MAAQSKEQLDDSADPDSPQTAPNPDTPRHDQFEGTPRLINVVVRPLVEPAWVRGCLLIMFIDVGAADEADQHIAGDAGPLIHQFEAEHVTRDTQPSSGIH